MNGFNIASGALLNIRIIANYLNNYKDVTVTEINLESESFC